MSSEGVGLRAGAGELVSHMGTDAEPLVMDAGLGWEKCGRQKALTQQGGIAELLLSSVRLY